MLKSILRNLLNRPNYEMKFQGQNVKDLKFIKF